MDNAHAVTEGGTMRARMVRCATLATLFACSSLFWPGQSAAVEPEGLGKFDVGYTTFRMDLIGVAGEPRPVDVEVWYPAKKENFANAPRAIYRSRLHGVTLDPVRWDPLSWELVSAIARKGAPIDDQSKAFPLVIFSHGNGSSPLDYIPTLEHLASHGYVVAAPWHARNNQDEVRAGFINRQAGWTTPGQPQLLPCPGVLPMPCSETATQPVAANRIRDISAIADTLPSVLGDRVNVDRIGVMGHSAGSITTFLAAGGSGPLGILPEPRVASVLGLTMINDAVIDQTNLANVTVPALLVAGELDADTPPARSARVYNGISSTEKGYVILSNAVHRSFSSAFCSQMQAAGSATQSNPVRGILDRHTLTNMIGNTVVGSTLDYCTYDYFTTPVDISALVSSLAGFPVTSTSVPRTGVSSDDVKRIVSELAVVFFRATLENKGQGRLSCYLHHKLVDKYAPFIEHVEFVSSYECADDGD